MLVLEERRVGDLPRLPDALRTETCSGSETPLSPADRHPQQHGTGLRAYLVVGVVDHGGLPLALVVGVVDHRPFPGAAAGGGLAGGVSDLRSLPFAVHVLVPDGQEVQRLSERDERLEFNLTH